MSDRYQTVIYYSENDGLYIAFAPDLPGCFADGETEKEARENIAIIIEEWIEYAQELGRAVPEPGSGGKMEDHEIIWKRCEKRCV